MSTIVDAALARKDARASAEGLPRKEVMKMATLKPGDKAPVSGIYEPAKRPGTPVAISQGETLPPTPKPNTDWKLKTPAKR